MKLTSREDIEAPIALVHSALTDFDHFETAAQRRGAEVIRDSEDGKLRWFTSFMFRQKRRNVTIALSRHEAPALLVFSFDSPNLSGEVTVELMTLGPKRTRKTTALDVRPKTLAARILMQPLKLARGRVLRRYRKRAAQFAALLETRALMMQTHGG